MTNFRKQCTVRISSSWAKLRHAAHFDVNMHLHESTVSIPKAYCNHPRYVLNQSSTYTSFFLSQWLFHTWYSDCIFSPVYLFQVGNHSAVDSLLYQSCWQFFVGNSFSVLAAFPSLIDFNAFCISSFGDFRR